MREIKNLLNRWHLRKLAYYEQMMQEYPDTPERNKIIWTMHYQLVKCIEELEDALAAVSPEERLTQEVINAVRRGTISE